MGKIKTVELSRAQRAAIEKGYRGGESHAFRLRCQMILLKSEQRTAREIADLLGCCEVVVNNWLKRFELEGIEGLRTKPGRGRKPILDTEKGLTASQSSNQSKPPTDQPGEGRVGNCLRQGFQPEDA